MTEVTKRDSEDNYNSFERALHSWANIDLPALQKTLDSEGLQIQEFQKSSLISRKDLATKTKSFKKLEQEEKLGEINPLLKSYQNEIDSLTKKNRSIETIFFSIYRAIVDAPDPKPLLESAIKAVESTKEAEILKQEKQELQDRLLKYADYDQLKSQSSRLQAQFEQKLANKERELQAVIDEKEQNWASKEKSLEKIISESKKEISELKISQEVMEAKLHNRSEIWDESELNSKASSVIQLEMIQRDAESSKMRVLQLEKRNEQLSKELSAVQNEDNANDKINELTTENVKLSAKLENEQSKINSLRRENSKTVDTLNVEIRQLKNEVETLKEKLSKTSDYEELKKELDTLKEIEFGGLNVDDDQQNKLDSIIIQTNRKLNADLVEYRSKNETLSKKIPLLEQEIIKLQEEVGKLSNANSSLEQDLVQVNGAAENGANWDTMSMISSISKVSKAQTDRKISPAASIAGSIVDGGSISGLYPDSSSNSILPIITQQRDRFRVRNKELEEEAKKQFSKIVELKREVAALKNDNKELYERIRYISSYSTINQQEKRRTTNLKNTSEFKYEEDYERQLHPIEQFRLKESQRISSKISPIERIYISMIRFILSSPLSRYLFAAYCLGLHFVIGVLFLYTTNLHMDVTADITEGSTGGIAGGSAAAAAVAAAANAGNDVVGEFSP